MSNSKLFAKILLVNFLFVLFGFYPNAQNACLYSCGPDCRPGSGALCNFGIKGNTQEPNQNWCGCCLNNFGGLKDECSQQVRDEFYDKFGIDNVEDYCASIEIKIVTPDSCNPPTSQVTSNVPKMLSTTTVQRVPQESTIKPIADAVNPNATWFTKTGHVISQKTAQESSSYTHADLSSNSRNWCALDISLPRDYNVRNLIRPYDECIAVDFNSVYGCHVILRYGPYKVLAAHLNYNTKDECMANRASICAGNMPAGSFGKNSTGTHLHLGVYDQVYGQTCRGESHPCSILDGGCRSGGQMVYVGTNASASQNSNTKIWMAASAQAATLDTKNLKPGRYEIEHNSVTTRQIYITGDDNEVLFFEDRNSDGIYDPHTESLLPNQKIDNIKIKKTAEVVETRLEVGWNTIAFPVALDSKFNSASKLIQEFGAQGANVTHVASYREGKFVMYSVREDDSGQKVSFGEDFALLPGEGYFLRSYTGIKVFFEGRAVEGSMKVRLDNGWNLVSFYKDGQRDFSGFGLLDGMNSQGVNADVLSKWEGGQYQNIVLANDTRYGNDFRVLPYKGYWVRTNLDDTKEFLP